MSSEEITSSRHQLNDNTSVVENGDLYLAAHAERARDAVVKSYRIIKVPDYFLDQWLPLLGPSRWLTVLAFRQLAFIHKCKEKNGKKPTRTTFRDLSKWSGQSRPQMHKLLKKPSLLTWFIEPAKGELGKHPEGRSERRTYLVRIEIPLTPQDQAKLEEYLRAQQPHDDEDWLQTLHKALEAKSYSLPPEHSMPDHPKTVQDMVREMRGPDKPLPEDIDWACDELLERWQTQSFGQVTHYFIKRWLPDLTPSLGCLFIWSRRHANKHRDESQIGKLHAGRWQALAEPIGVTAKSVRRWFQDDENYPHTHKFMTPIPVYEGAGTIDRISGSAIRVGKETISLIDKTVIKDTLHVGDFVKLSAELRDGSYNALSLELANEVDYNPFLGEVNLTFDVKLTEPIHDADLAYYKALLQDQVSQDNEAEILPSNVERHPTINVQHKGEAVIEADILRTKIDYSLPEIDTPSTEVDMQSAKIDTTGADVNSSVSVLENLNTDVDNDRPEVDALRIIKDDSRASQLKVNEEQLPCHSPHSADYHSTALSKEQAAVASPSDWIIDNILTQGAIPKRDRDNILSIWPRQWRNFVAWLLWSLATSTIDAPIVHTVTRVKRGEIPPRDFVRLAGEKPMKLAEWIGGRGEYALDYPETYRNPILQLRKNDAYWKLRYMGAFGGVYLHAQEEVYEESAADMGSEMVDEGDLQEKVNQEGMTVQQAWKEVKRQLELELPRASYDTWVRDVQLVDYRDEDTIVLAVGNTYARDWLRNQISHTAERAMEGVVGRTMKVKIIAFGDEE